LGVNGFETNVDPQTVNPAEWAAKHFGAGHSADALARHVNRLASDWLEAALAELVAAGYGPDRVMVHYGPGTQIQVSVDGTPRKCWSVAMAPAAG
jgi:hypothetical protein